MNKDGREFLRLRKDGNLNELTYKNAIYENGKFKRMIENSATINDTESLKIILNDLGFREHIIINKSRETFKDGMFEICLDILDHLGHFIEIERKGDFDSVEVAKRECLDKAKEIGINDLKDCPTGYVQLMEEKKKGNTI